MDKKKPIYRVVETVNWGNHWEISMALPRITKIKFPFNPDIPFLKGLKISYCNDIHIHIFIAVRFITKSLKLKVYLLTDEPIKNMSYYSAIKKHKF